MTIKNIEVPFLNPSRCFAPPAFAFLLPPPSFFRLLLANSPLRRRQARLPAISRRPARSPPNLTPLMKDVRAVCRRKRRREISAISRRSARFQRPRRKLSPPKIATKSCRERYRRIVAVIRRLRRLQNVQLEKRARRKVIFNVLTNSCL